MLIRIAVTLFDEMYTAECSVLNLVTEAHTISALVERVQLIAPEMLELNSIEINPDSLILEYFISLR